MSRLSIYANSWINLVFEGRNQEYGAYQLRRKSDETTLLAFCLGISIVAMLLTIPLLISSFNPNHTAVIKDPVLELPEIHVTKFHPQIPKKPTTMALPATKKAKDDITRKELVNPEIVNPTDVTAEPARNNEHPANNPESPDNGIKGTAPVSAPAAPLGIEKPGIPATAPTDIHNVVTVDKLPEYPGGIQAFYTYIGNNFEKLEVEETISVIVAFVIEKDGSMTDIRVMRSAAPSIDREAIRVLKSLRTKWKPGIKDGKPVRTEYKLPIKVKK